MSQYDELFFGHPLPFLFGLVMGWGMMALIHQ